MKKFLNKNKFKFFNYFAFLVILIFIVVINISIPLVSATGPTPFPTSPALRYTDYNLCTGSVAQAYCYNDTPQPTLNWSVTWKDHAFPETTSNAQTAYWLQIDNNADFASPEYDTDVVSSALLSLQIPLLNNSLTYNAVYNWRVAIKDNVGSWSSFAVGDPFTTRPTCVSIAPTISSISSSAGPAVGGTTVTITGTNLMNTTLVTFGGTAGISLTNVSATSITVVTPAKTAGAVNVVLTTLAGTVTQTDWFTFVDAPTITTISRTAGPTAGGTTLTITGTTLTGTTVLTFGGTAGTSLTNVSATSITVVTPAKTAGAVNVVLSTIGGTATKTNGFTFIAPPTILTVSPTGGPIIGGTIVTITGTILTDTISVTFGDTAGTSLTNISATSITVVTPAKTAGAADVIVTTANGDSSVASTFTYFSAPTITSVSPAVGPITGGTNITIKGTNFLSGGGVGSGGTITYTDSNGFNPRSSPAYADGYVVHTFTSSGAFIPSRARDVSVLVVAGGGGGGMDMGGGGGGGGVIYSSSLAVTSGIVMPVVVGLGGNGAPAAGASGQPTAHQYTIRAQSGNNSSFGGLVAIGGGFGGSSHYAYTPGIAGGTGGSGGGASGYNPSAGTFYGGAGTASQGNSGGNSSGSYYSGGGGGAGGVGANAPNQPNGGIGIFNLILGTAYYWGGGGGGSAYTLSAGGSGGVGGGGGGAIGSAAGGAGLNNGQAGGGGSSNAVANTPGGNGGANTGGGGGGGSHYNSNNNGGNGGSGVVIIRYRMPDNVTIGGVSATNIVIVDSTTITATTPSNANIGAVDVVIINPDGQNVTESLGFNYYFGVPYEKRYTDFNLCTGSVIQPYTSCYDDIPQPIFNWSETWKDHAFPESTSNAQTAFWLQVDDNTDFSSPEYDSGVQLSSLLSFKVPILNNSIAYESLNNWRIAIRDNVGSWSNFAVGAQFTTMPSCVSLLPTISSVIPNTGPTSGGTSVTITGTNFLAGGGIGLGGTITYTDSNGLNPRSSPVYADGYIVHTFTSSGIFTPLRSGNIAVLVVAGGGGGSGGVGGVNYGNGGGGGTVKYNSSFAVIPQPYTITVGGGGAGVNTGTPGTGGSSVFETITSTGGTGTANSSRTGGANANYSGGGTSLGYDSGAGAGGGQSANVSAAGNGYQSSISGIMTYYAGGGGAVTSVGQTGGLGGGGAGSTGAGTSGTANTGGGGGGSGGTTGGSGGSGIVIIRYRTPDNVTFGGIPATNIQVVSPTTITATTPPKDVPGAFDVVMTNPNAQSITKSQGFTYTLTISDVKRYSDYNLCNGSYTNLGCHVGRPQPTFNWSYVWKDHVFSESMSNAQTAFSLQVDNNLDFSSPEYDSGIQSSSALSYQLSTLNNSLNYGSTYYWRIAGKDNVGSWSSYAISDLISTSAVTGPTPFPSVSGYSDFNLCTSQVGQPLCYTDNVIPTLNWSTAWRDHVFSGSLSTSQSAYWLQVDNNADFSSPEYDTDIQLSSVSSFQLGAICSALVSDTIYYWRVSIRDNVGSWSDFAVGTPFTTAPSCFLVEVPTFTSIVKQGDCSTFYAKIYWKDYSTTAATSYHVRKKTASTDWSEACYVTSFTRPSVSCSDYDIVNDTDYYYQVNVCNGAYCTDWSPLGGYAFNPGLCKIVIIMGSYSCSSVNINWLDGVSGTAYYDIYRQQNGMGDYIKIGSTTSPTVNYSDTDILSGAGYRYIIKPNGLDQGASNPSDLIVPCTKAPQWIETR